MLKDHLGNVRMVLTEEVKPLNTYPASTLEGIITSGALSMINYEKQFYTINNTYVVAKTTMPGWTTAKDYQNNNGNPPANTSYPPTYTITPTGTSDKVYKLNATTNKVGLGMVIKVMAGDRVDIHGKSYYQSTTTYNNTNSTVMTLAEILGGFVGSPDNAGFIGKGLTSANLQSTNTGLVPSSFIRGNNNESTTVPKAYINYLVFDEQFKYVTGNASRVGVSGTVKNHWAADAQLQNINIPKNGYLYVYVSNESNANVFFDNLQVFHTQGALLEETHYYPFGLTMSGISSKAANTLENKRKYAANELQEKEFSDGGGLDFYDFNARTYDQQIGRFLQIDPLSNEEDQESWTPYHYTFNNPILHTDPDGKLPIIPVIIWGYRAYRAYKAYQAIQRIATTKVGMRLSPMVSTLARAQWRSTAAKSEAQERADKLSKKDRSGKDMTKAGKDAVKDLNKEKNNGEMVCENCGRTAVNGKQHKTGETPPGNEAHVDHKDPKSNGGNGTPNNGQVLCRDCNLNKGAKLPTKEQ
jgi:RHS repeat-associated protein